MKPRNRHNPKSSYWQWSRYTPTAIAGLITTVAIVAPARAAVLNTWTFDTSSRQLVVTLPAGVTPDFFLLAEPARIVLNLPNTTLGDVPPEQTYPGSVSRIRVAEVQGASRIVIELAPNTRLDPRHAELTAAAAGNGQTRWTLRPLIQGEAPTVAATTAPVSPAAPEPNPPPLPQVDPTPPDAVEPLPAPTATFPVPQIPGEPAVPASDPSDLATGAIAPEPVPLPAPAETPPPALPEATAPLPARPAATAQTAAAGAAQGLSEPLTDLPGVRTDAAALSQADVAAPDFPPDQLPLDSFSPSNQATVAVPPLAEPAAAVPPSVTVPALANSPEPTLDAAVTDAAAAPTAAAAPRPPSAAAIAASPVDRPTSPAPPAAQRQPNPAVPAPNQVRPPSPGAIADTPNATPADIPTAATPVAPNAAPVAQPSIPAAEPAPPSPEAAPTPLPPPFLAGTGAMPSPEQPSIPPPPPLPGREGTIPFGAPLPPQTKSEGTSAPAGDQHTSYLPVGTRLLLQYPGTEPLMLTQPDPWYEVLIVAEDVYDPVTQARLLAAGTQVLGRFEGFDESGRRFVTQLVIEGSDRHPLLAESEWLTGDRQTNDSNVLLGSDVGAVAATVLTGFSGLGLLGGAAIGAASGWATAPQTVSIQPGQVIEVEVVGDILPFNDAPNLAAPQPEPINAPR